MLDRIYDPKTATWIGNRKSPIPAEVMQCLLNERATGLDLLYVLLTRDVIEAMQAGKNVIYENGVYYASHE